MLSSSRNSRSQNSALGFPFGRDSLLSEFFDRDPFDDPFLKQPFGNFFSSPDDFFKQFHQGNTFGRTRDEYNEGSNKGIVIEEMSEDHEETKKRSSKTSKEPIVEHPDDVNTSRNRSVVERDMPKSFCNSYCYSSVTYGGPGGTYYKSATTRRTGADGVIEEHHEESDSRTGQEVNQLLRRLGNKGHAVTRKRDMGTGAENFIETLHNITEEEKKEFDETWKRHAEKSLPGWTTNRSKKMLEHGSSKGKVRRAALTSSSSGKDGSSSADSGWKWPWAKKA